VIYDISETKSRTKLSKYLQSFGLKRIQYSGFLGELDGNDRQILSKEVKKYVSGEDSIYVIPLCERCVRLVKIVSENEVNLEDENVKIV